MHAENIIAWLERKRRRGIAVSVFLAVLALVSGLLVLFLTFWFTYAVLWVGMGGVSAVSELILNKHLALPHEWRLVVSGIFILLLFFGNARTSREYLAEYPKRNYVAAPGLQYTAGTTGSLLWMLAYPGASSKMITDLLYTGPRLIAGTTAMAARAARFKHLEVESCARLLTHLLGRTSVSPYHELASLLPDSSVENIRDMFSLIDGMIILQAGLKLDAELRRELSGFPADG